MKIELWGIKVELTRNTLVAILQGIVSAQMPLWLFLICLSVLGILVWQAWKFINRSQHITVMLSGAERIKLLTFGNAGYKVQVMLRIMNFSAYRDFSLDELVIRFNTVVEGTVKSKILARSRVSWVVVESPLIDEHLKQWLTSPESRLRLSGEVKGSFRNRKIQEPFDFGEVKISLDH